MKHHKIPVNEDLAYNVVIAFALPEGERFIYVDYRGTCTEFMNFLTRAKRVVNVTSPAKKTKETR